jgi:PST family polysaccharide transporter
MTRYGAGAAGLELAGVISERAHVVAIGRTLGDGALGLFTVAARLPELLIENVAWNVSIVAFPAFAKRRADGEDLAGMTADIVRMQSLYALPLATGMAVLAGPLIVTLFGPAWSGAAGVAATIAIVSGAGAVIFPIGDVYKALGRQGRLAGLNLYALPLYVAGVIVFAPAGILAVALVRLVTRLLWCAIVVVDAARITGLRLRVLASALRPAFAAAVGVALGAGAVRLAWPADAAGPLVAGALAGAALGAVALFAVTGGRYVPEPALDGPAS